MMRSMEQQRSFQDESLTAEIVPLRRYALSLTRDRDSAEDLVQTSLVRALSRAQQFQAGTNLRAWLFTIVRNEFISSKRSARTRGPHISIDDAGYDLPCKAGQEAHVELKEVTRVIMRLPPAERSLLGRIAYEGQTYPEAAIALNVAVGTVKSRISRTRARLHLGLISGNIVSASPRAYTLPTLVPPGRRAARMPSLGDSGAAAPFPGMGFTGRVSQPVPLSATSLGL